MHENNSNSETLKKQADVPVKLSVIIPCYNGEEYLGMQLEALVRQKWDEAWEILLADNRSTDASVMIARQYQEKLPNLRIISAPEKQGKPYAVNVAARVAKGDALLFIDADDEVGEGWLIAMGEALKTHDFVASRIDIEKLNSAELQKARPNPQKDGLQQYTYPPYLPHAGGGTLGVKRLLFEAVGGMDENMLLLEDTDFCWRLQNAGAKLYFVPEAVLHYRYRGSVFSLFKQGISYGEYNVVLYKRYRNHGMAKLEPKKGLYKWIKLFLHSPRLLDNEQRPRYMRVLGWNIGRLIGSAKHRIWAL